MPVHFRKMISVFVTAMAFAVSAFSQTGTVCMHTVRAGETLYSISRAYGLSVDALREANIDLVEPLRVGATLKVPASGEADGIFHTIQAGETLYSLSKKYGVSQDELTKANPGLSTESFRAGATLKIPVSRFALTKVDTVASKVASGIAGSNCREMYRVEKKETLLSIAGKYGVSPREIMAANPDVKSVDKKLRRGTFVCIPYAEKPNTPMTTLPRTAAAPVAAAVRIVPEQKSYRVALLMPFYDDPRSLNFYRGLLYEVGELRKGGTSFTIEAHNAGRSLTDARQLLTRESLAAADVIISSASEAVSHEIAEFCKDKGPKMFLPLSLAFDDVFSNSHVAMANLPRSYELAYACSCFMRSLPADAGVVYFEGEKQSELAGQILEALAGRNITVSRARADMDAASFAGCFRAGRPNVVVLSSPSRRDYDALCSQLKKAAIPSVEYSVWGYGEWRDFDAATREGFYTHGVTFCTQQFINVYSPRYAPLRTAFTNNFGHVPSTAEQRAFLLGVDCADQLFASAPASAVSRPLSMRRVTAWGGMIGAKLRVVRYQRNHTVVIDDYEN